MKQMSLIEMDGFLKGKCIPRDLKVNETNAEYLVRKFAEAEAKCAALAAENAGLKAAHPQPFGHEMMKALDAYEKHQDEVPETGMLNAFFILRDSIRVDTPATDAFLAEVRAQCLNAFIQHHSAELDAHIKNGGEQFDEKSVRIRDIIVSARLFREQIRKEAAQ
ncbi:TPA: hypothetical protein NV593_002987 [Escherichia coli]|nr:hypothetical protein [Escherichia coli]